MLRVDVFDRNIRFVGYDYVFEDMEKFYKMLPYLEHKIEGEWKIAIVEPKPDDVRVLISKSVPDYLSIECFMDKSSASQILKEHPSLLTTMKSNYDRYMDLIASLHVLIAPDAMKELYKRVGVNKNKLEDYLNELSIKASDGVITLKLVKSTVFDERTIYASDVIMAFMRHDRYMWKKYNEFVSILGKRYAFYALRKFVNKLLAEKNKYLNNEDTSIKDIDKIDAYIIDLAFALFNTMTVDELDICMYLIANRDLARRFL